VCGGIASGKTTLASLLERLGFVPILENFQVSPFLEAFYRDPAKYTFETEISFLLLHYHQIKKVSEPEIANACDFSMTQDLAYAKMGLNGTKLQAFGAVYDEVKRDLGNPQLLVHLKCDAQTELQRIRSRARSIEALITMEFLENLNSAIEREVVAIQSDVHVISIDSAALNFADNESIKEGVVDRIWRTFSPTSLAPKH
jgi:deoxyadenosine/deoxycytidine kinase